ncbi:ribosomal RNA small subunit methyltransferase B [Sulfuriferula plumbiphila]|uniref:16S rRNA (cytosine(967)-C(5))-methyltransferase n=1 Tax=Sulfuriferula plumbiphila TaxID=171865 RepID=A0A512L3H8_9PROT|nr:16S rRNA (cytosine(967)-C(5))-methyltransferase RsmB [Sulfuriferula plumbiphila]BBP02724.1 ribosomal RNA small subunit methyltransferase B [Sulfuriferula plumbiphila]GEP29018.1 ribosomal RNA small subunit methyltransferase B [Sulfuriferula plumbiphila]
MSEPIHQPPLRQLLKRAACALDAVVHKGQNLNHVLAQQPVAGRATVQDISYGSLREYALLAALRDALLSNPLKDSVVAALLVVALRQLRVRPDATHTVVNEAVEAAAAIQPWARGLVNGVLRNYLRQADALTATLVQKESVRWNYPQWWIDRLRVAYPEHWQAALAAGNRHAPMTLRVNQHHGSTAAYLELLRDAGVEATQTGEFALQLAHPIAVAQLPGFASGRVSVQDAGAQLAALLLDLHDGQRVLDACAAPGGKTGHILETADVALTALDSDTGRLERVRENLERLQLKATLASGDAAQPDTWWDGRPFERILADVPCSASGVVRRHPDIKWLRRPHDIAHFAAQQAAMLPALWRCLARGGKLLYATCSIFPEENQRLVDAFLDRHENARQLSLAGEWINPGQLLPNDQHDGFFYALLAKN